MRLIIALLILWILVTFAIIPLVKNLRRAGKHTAKYIDKQYKNKEDN